MIDRFDIEKEAASMAELIDLAAADENARAVLLQAVRDSSRRLRAAITEAPSITDVRDERVLLVLLRTVDEALSEGEP